MRTRSISFDSLPLASPLEGRTFVQSTQGVPMAMCSPADE